MVSALVSLLAPNIAAGPDAKAGGLLTASPFDAMGPGLNFSSLLSFTGKNDASLEKLNELLTAAGTGTAALNADQSFASLLQLPGQELAELDKVDMIDQSVMVAAIMLPVLPTPTPESAALGIEEGTLTDEMAALPETAPSAASAPQESPAVPEMPDLLQEAIDNAARAPKTASESAKGTEENMAAVTREIAGNTTIRDITNTVDVSKIVPLEKLLPSLAHSIADTSLTENEAKDALADDVPANPTLASAAPDLWNLVATALKPFSASTEAHAKISDREEMSGDSLKAAPGATPLAAPKEEFKIPTKAELLGFDEENEEEKKPQRKESKTKADAAPQAAVQQVEPQPAAPKVTAENLVKSLAGDANADFTQGDSMDRQSGNAQQTDQRAALIDLSVNKDQKLDPAFLKLVKTSSHEHASPGEQVMVSIKQAFGHHNQGDHIRVQLTPHDMGSVDITMTIKGDEITQIRILAEKAETLDLLKNDSRFLERSLQESGLKAETGGLQFGLKEQGGGNAHSDRNGNGNHRSPLPYDGKPSQGEDDPATLKWNTTGGAEVLMATTGINIKV